MQLNVVEYLEQGALASVPRNLAVSCGDAGLTFEELWTCARQFAAKICELQSQTTAAVCVYLPKGPETVAANLGILLSRNCYSNLDVKSPAARIKVIIDSVKPIAIITSRQLQTTLLEVGIAPDVLILTEDCDQPVSDEAEQELSQRRERALDVDPVCIINTSGSTGVPKSVVMNHRNIIDFIDWTLDEFPFNQNDVIGSLSPFYFDIYTLELFVSLATGARLSIVPDNHAPYPARLLEYLVAQNVSFIFWVPSIMVNIANLGLLEKYPLKSLRRIFFAGEVFPTRQFNQWCRTFPEAEFVNLYGPIEITVDCTFYRIDREFNDDEPIPIGIPCRNTEILILTEDNRAAQVGEQGELCVRGSSLAMGYWNQPEKTAAVFVQNPLITAYPDKIYRTGDVASWNDRGQIMFLGRRDYQIKHLGYRIELGEIETAVTATSLVEAACVLYHATKREICLCYSAAAEVPVGQFREKLSQRLPKYMLPTVFIYHEQLPQNANGKIDRLSLMNQLLERP